MNIHKKHNIKVWKENGQFFWEGNGIISSATVKGCFTKAKRRKPEEEEEEEEDPIICYVSTLLGRKPTASESKKLEKKGLLDKTVWYKKDIERLRKTLKFNKVIPRGMIVQKNNFCSLFLLPLIAWVNQPFTVNT